MKSLIALMFLISSTSFAYEVPKDAVIKVFDKNGKEIGNMSRSEYKVVKLGTSKVKTVVVTKVVTEKVKPKMNRLTVKAGVGHDGLDVSHNGSKHTVSSKKRAVLGVGYSRKIKKDLSLGISTHTNETTTLDLGVDF